MSYSGVHENFKASRSICNKVSLVRIFNAIFLHRANRRCDEGWYGWLVQLLKFGVEI